MPRTKRAKPTAFRWPERSLRLWTCRHPMPDAYAEDAARAFAREYFSPFPREVDMSSLTFAWGPDARAVSTPIGAGTFQLAGGSGRRYRIFADSLGWWTVYAD